jgi:hypothetical protein
MKLQAEYNYVVERFKKINNLPAYAEQLKASGEYQVFENRLAWDCLRSAVGVETICDWYDKYNCTDEHIQTLALKALKQVYKAQ